MTPGYHRSGLRDHDHMGQPDGAANSRQGTGPPLHRDAFSPLSRRPSAAEAASMPARSAESSCSGPLDMVAWVPGRQLLRIMPERRIKDPTVA